MDTYLPTYLNVSSLDCINVGFYLAIFFFQSFHQFVLLPPITSDVHPACVAPSTSSSTASSSSSSSSSSSQSNPVNKDEVGSWQRGGGTWILENVRQWVSSSVSTKLFIQQLWQEILRPHHHFNACSSFKDMYLHLFNMHQPRLLFCSFSTSSTVYCSG